MRMILQVLVIAEQRVPVQATSVALHCGEEALTVEVSQNFLGNCCRLLVWIDPMCLMFLSTKAHLTCWVEVRGPKWISNRIVEDWTNGTDSMLINIVCTNFLTLRKEYSTCTPCWDVDFTVKKPFCLSSGWTWVLLTSGNGSYLSESFPVCS